MRDSLYLAWRYVCHHRVTTAVLVASITLIAYLPVALQLIVNSAEQHFRARAESTPLVVGPRGSQLELILACVFFDRPHETVMRMEQAQRIDADQLGQTIPLHVRFRTRDCPIVGTTSDYFDLRNLHVAKGSGMRMLGECVVGARAAERLGITVGSKIPVTSAPTFVLDDAPLRLHVVGILAATETPDDHAIFVELETTWVLEGLGHGHVSGVAHGSPEAAEYTDITEDNVSRFHFHSDQAKFPITAIFVLPTSQKNETLLEGHYLSPEDTAQLARPSDVMNAMLEKVLMVRSYMIVMIVIVSSVTVLTLALVIALSIRLRKNERCTMAKLGCSRWTLGTILGGQMLLVLAASAALTVILVLVTDAYGTELVRLLIL